MTSGSRNNEALRVPCTYQGGKQRVASEIVDRIIGYVGDGYADTDYYDVCCGSGAVSVELVNRGIEPGRITMVDKGPWGVFWNAIGSGTFDLKEFETHLDRIPVEKRDIKAYMESLAACPIGEDAVYVYPILQSCSFGGKQIWQEGDRWVNAFFRDYWEPTESSVRRSPANPMQPSPKTLYQRVARLVEACRGLTCVHGDVLSVMDMDIGDDSVVYVDPPYAGTTGYGYGFDVLGFSKEFVREHGCPQR